jgi:hypothetical protein
MAGAIPLESADSKQLGEKRSPQAQTGIGDLKDSLHVVSSCLD